MGLRHLHRRRGWRLAVMLGCLMGGLAGVTPTTFAQSRIDTDGPDFVESAEVVGTGRFQFEAGPAVEHDRRSLAVPAGGPTAGTARTYPRFTASLPTLLRYGVSPTVELRMESDVAHWSRDSTDRSDVALGVKWHVLDRQAGSFQPALSWIAHLQLPAGDHDPGTRVVVSSLRAVFGWDLPGGLTAGLMPGVKYQQVDDDPRTVDPDGHAPGQRSGHPFVSGIFGATVGKWWTGNFRSFVELSADRIATSADGGTSMAWDVGAAYLLGDNWQIGGRVAFAANRNTPCTVYLISLSGRL